MSGKSGKSGKTRPTGATASGEKKTGSSAGTAQTKGVAAPAKLSARWLIIGSGLVAVILVVVLGAPFAINQKSAGPAASPAGGAPAASLAGNVVQGNGGHWTNISSDTLASMLDHKDFTFLNVKTPYIGEIDRTDLYIPYTALAARAGELPADKAAPIVVYCRSGNESGIASQTLLDLGYTNIYNLDGGMNAWTASGRQIVDKNRS